MPIPTLQLIIKRLNVATLPIKSTYQEFKSTYIFNKLNRQTLIEKNPLQKEAINFDKIFRD